MKTKVEISLLAGAYIIMLLAMFILPFFSVPSQSIIRNTLSDLGAQSTSGSWIINSIFVLLSISSVISGWKCFEGFTFHRIILILFGNSLTLTAFINQAPVGQDICYNISEDGWHSYFVCTTWVTFIILSFSTALILENQTDMQMAIAACISAMLFSLLAAEADCTAGIWQRFLFIISFGWMIYIFKSPVNKNKKYDSSKNQILNI